jgi:streptomycin 6-kinase
MVLHGSNAIAVPVVRAGEPLILRMTPPGSDMAEQVRALRWRDGCGMVQLYDADPERPAWIPRILTTFLT